MNRAILIGRLTKDPELKCLANGTSVATFTLAVDRGFTNKSGEREADFISIVVWRGLAENCVKYLAKGRMAAVAGRIQTRNYDTSDGQRRYITEIVADEVKFLDYKQNKQQDSVPGFSPMDADDDELPF